MSRSHKRGAPEPTTTTSTASSEEERKKSGGTDALTLHGNDAIRDMAKEGASTAGTDMPYLDQIQESFGAYDISSLTAHEDKDATSEMSAKAYAWGDDIVFQSRPDLHTAAHEAAHVMQQGAGKGPSAGVGEVGDSYEKHADEVADRVQAGRSAEDVLDKMIGGPQKVGPHKQKAVQRKEDDAPVPEKRVSSKGMGRLLAAQMAIEETKKLIPKGAGNQKEALEDTNFNSYFRMAAMRDPSLWNMSPEAAALGRDNPQALTTAMAQQAGGGNCGEHAQIAFDYLRRNLPGDKIMQMDVSGLDHAFIMIGDMDKDAPSDLVICDPWPTAATACLWEDHFAYTPERGSINNRGTAQNNPADIAGEISKGLSLNEQGQAYIQQSFTPEQTAEEIKKGTSGDHPWIWNHPNAASEVYKYRMAPGEQVDASAYSDHMFEQVSAFLQSGSSSSTSTGQGQRQPAGS